MDKKKQIEEMSAEIREAVNGCSSYWSGLIAEHLHEQGYRKQEWISVDERLPDIIDTFLVVVKMKYPWEETWEYNVDVAVYQPFEEGYIEHWDTWNDWDEGQECHITHWLPLPEAPKMKGGAE